MKALWKPLYSKVRANNCNVRINTTQSGIKYFAIDAHFYYGNGAYMSTTKLFPCSRRGMENALTWIA